MSARAKWIGVALVVLGIVTGTGYVWGAVRHHGSNGTAATTISPEELTLKAGPLPETAIGSYL